MKEGVLINFSGHPLNRKVIVELKKSFLKIEEIPFDKLVFTENIQTQIETIIEKVKTPLDGSIPITIILPGHSVISALVMVYLNGCLGYFPKICLLEPTEDGIYSPSQIVIFSTYNVKMHGREFRNVAWKRRIEAQEKEKK
ncbi:MAG: hypothetical protein KA149_08395 [Chitinophagales bacterium]|nr:hypothetical protein [Chitinophagales bacterium]